MNNTHKTPAFRMDCHGGCGFGVSYPEGPTTEERRALNASFEAHLDRCPAEARRRENMKLIHAYVMGAEGKALPPKVQRRIDDTIWDLQDGYGEAGFTPAQGWDWSGIRDSSPQTVECMARAIRHIVGIAA